MYVCVDIPDTGLLCDLLWADPDKDIVGWGENDRGAPSFLPSFLPSHTHTDGCMHVCMYVAQGCRSPSEKTWWLSSCADMT